MQTHRGEAVRRWQLISTQCVLQRTQCVLNFGVIVEVPLCSEASVQLPEQGSPAALIVSFRNQGWSRTPVNTELIISNKQANKSHLPNGPPQMNLLVHDRIWEIYINAGSCGCLNVPVLPHNCRKALERETLELGLTQVAIVDDPLVLVIWVVLCVQQGPWGWVQTVYRRGTCGMILFAVEMIRLYASLISTYCLLLQSWTVLKALQSLILDAGLHRL